MRATLKFVVLVAALGIHGALAGPLSGADKRAVGEALSEALGVMSGNVQSDSKLMTCMNAFPDGKPPPDAAKDVMWQSCKSELPQSYRRARSMLLSKQRQPLTAAQRNKIGNALSESLSVMSGKKAPPDMYQSCMQIFPKGKPEDTSSPMWKACKDELTFMLAQRAVRIVRAAAPISAEDKEVVANALTGALKAIQGKSDGGDIWSQCDDMFPDGKRDADTPETDPTWQACKDKVWDPDAHKSTESLVAVTSHKK